MESKFKIGQLVIYWEMTDQRIYPAQIIDFRQAEKPNSHTYEYKIAVDFGYILNGKSNLEQMTVPENFLYHFSEFQLSKKEI